MLQNIRPINLTRFFRFPFNEERDNVYNKFSLYLTAADHNYWMYITIALTIVLVVVLLMFYLSHKECTKQLFGRLQSPDSHINVEEMNN
jgi:hypothetical protein